MGLTRDEAVGLCEAVRADNARKLWSAGHWQCWGCMKFGGVPEKRCMHSDDGSWDACPQVNRMASRA